jgi:dihydroorotate dehydrogenase (NAD+) catalytic subunit
VIELTKPGKNALTIESPVMPAAGTFGFGDSYRDLIDVEKLGALVTNPVTYQPWNPASGTHVVSLDAGILVHTGLPNPGVTKIVTQYHALWKTLPVPVILHLVGTGIEDVRNCVKLIDHEYTIDAIELGLNDDVSHGTAERLIRAAVDAGEKPIIVRLPFTDAEVLGAVAADAGAHAVTVCAAPRGTARDAGGRLIAGRVYGPLIKPMILRLVGLMARRLQIPVIGAGGIHSPNDARDYIEAGARAVQVDALTWVRPQLLEMIARDLGGLVLTQPTGALYDEWHPGIGKTELEQKKASQSDPTLDDQNIEENEE